MVRYKLKEETISQAKPEHKTFQKERIDAFGDIIGDIEIIRDAMLNAKQKTITYYQHNPESFDVLISTDIIKDYLNDIKILLK